MTGRKFNAAVQGYTAESICRDLPELGFTNVQGMRHFIVHVQ